METQQEPQPTKDVATKENADISFSSSNSQSSNNRKKKGFSPPNRLQRSRSKSPQSNVASEQKQKNPRSRSGSRNRRNEDRGEIRRNDRGNDYKQSNRYDRDRGDRGDNRRRQRITFPSFNKPMVTKKEFENYQDSRLDKQEVYDAYNNYIT